MKNVYIVMCKIRPISQSTMFGDLSGAYVSCYAQASSCEVAVEMCLESLRFDGMHVEEVSDQIHKMKASDWSLHLMDQWPLHVSQLPSQAEFEEFIYNNEVVYGPFGAFE
ncbi:hypothetical protein [Maricaulis parjimensis]|uniref:hypothetical protein n=1 Tax=Maricaulis parjimensis TaxID=144023 RepID=UPI001939EC90|nr:hypothetical protein [Maricaulis parjimensis]